jgi:DNA primase
LIPQSFIDDLLQRVDVVDIVGRHVKLKKGGANWMGLCPFHNEKSPSFSVSPTKQFYHCFGCGAHGTAVGFLIEYSGLTFPEAVRDLAQSVGMTVPDTRAESRFSGAREPRGEGRGEADDHEPFDQSESRSSMTSIIEALEIAGAFYRQTLRGATHAIDYLKGRGLTGEIAARFGLGYAPDGWNGLQAAFTDYRSPVLADAGLVVTKEGEGTAAGRTYDRFRDRVMFPIRNGRGRVIGFGGRVIDAGEPKYLNSPETPVFQKGQELYGLFEARSAIREAGFALVVEGYMDVVALAQHGVANAVATLGTACTPTHVQKLMRQIDRVTFSFDGDAAGRKAAWRALESALPFATDDKTLSFLFLPTEHDPDSYIRELGRDAFLEAVRAALPLSEYVLREVAPGERLRTAEGRAKALFDAKPLVKALPSGALRMQLVRALATRTGAAVEEILESFQIKAARPVTKALRRTPRQPPVGLAHRALTILLMYPTHAETLGAADLTALEEGAGDSRELVAELVATAKAQGHAVDFVGLADVFRESVNRDVFEGLVQEILSDEDNRRDVLPFDGEEDEAKIEAKLARRKARLELAHRELHDVVKSMRKLALKVEIDALIASGLPDEDSKEKYLRLIEEQKELRRA